MYLGRFNLEGPGPSVERDPSGPAVNTMYYVAPETHDSRSKYRSG